MELLAFIYPITYCWYIAVPETIYIIYAALRSAAYNGPAILYFIGLVIYDLAFMLNPEGTMAITAVLIAIDIYLHCGKTIKNTPIDGITYKDEFEPLDPYDPANPYNNCPDCGSGDTDGNHCYDCGEEF